MKQNNNDTTLKKEENDSGIIEIQRKLEKPEWRIIGQKKVWTRECPRCHEEIMHYCRDSVNKKINLDRICRKCWKKQKTNILERVCPKCNITLKYKTYKNFWKANKNNNLCRHCSKLNNSSRKGQKCSEIHKIRVGLSQKGKIISPETRLKMRDAAIKRMNKLGITQYRNFNPIACTYIDKLNEEMGWNLQHAKNGGELTACGYFLDGYDKQRNIVIEYDEIRHERPSIKKKDNIRQEEIINHLKCQFYRYKECDNTLIKVR